LRYELIFWDFQLPKLEKEKNHHISTYGSST